MCERVHTLRGSKHREAAEVLRSYSLEHDCGEQLEPLLRAYRDAVNQILRELWGQHRVREEEVKGGKKQWRLLPKYKVDVKSKKYKKELRDRLL